LERPVTSSVLVVGLSSWVVWATPTLTTEVGPVTTSEPPPVAVRAVLAVSVTATAPRL
jgi:hypothetical protein